KIFMGDVGSGFIGITLAMTSLYAAGLNPEFLWAWLILSAIFIVDATVTLISRLAQGEKLHEAHRTHAYQHLAQRAGSHTPVVTGILLINILVLMPLAILSMKGTVPAEVCFLLAYTPLALLSVAVGAGRRGQAQRV